eukprot:14735326-Alexandrium_andersonii.AAC.1
MFPSPISAFGGPEALITGPGGIALLREAEGSVGREQPTLQRLAPPHAALCEALPCLGLLPGLGVD